MSVELWNVLPHEEFERDILQKTDLAARKKLIRNEYLSTETSILGTSSSVSEIIPRQQNLSIFLSTLYDDILFDINVQKLWKNKSKTLIWAIYVWLLHLLRMYLRPEDFKYATQWDGAYREVYSDMLDSQTEEEQTKLFQTANWMGIFFQLVPAKNNKIMAVNVVPKFLEGWEVKYTTGRGMTRPTKNRYAIIHIESGILRPKRDRSTAKEVPDKRLKTTHADHPSLHDQSHSSSSSSFVPLNRDLSLGYEQIQPFRCEEDDSFIASLPSIEEMDKLPHSLHEIFVEDLVASTSHSSSSSSSSTNLDVTLDTRFLLP